MIDNLFETYFKEHDPVCLYCNTHIDDSSSESANFFYYTKLICASCDEIFIDIYFYGAAKDKSSYFIFTCNDLQVSVNSRLNSIQINRVPLTFSFYGEVLDSFTLDFKNKEALYNKLKTYLMFT